MVKSIVMETNSDNSSAGELKGGTGLWTVNKLIRAGKLLKSGFSPQQVGSQLLLSVEQIEELAQDIVAENEQPGVLGHSEWRKQEAESCEKKIVGIAKKHLESLEGFSGLDQETITGFKDVAGVVHKWLRSGESTAKIALINIDFLSEVRPYIPGQPKEKVVDIMSEDVGAV